jgi:protein-tyrosine phosphatase
VLIHCVGGLGRAGTVVACWLRTQGFGTEEAVAVVRSVRSPRAIETEIQERTIARFLD